MRAIILILCLSTAALAAPSPLPRVYKEKGVVGEWQWYYGESVNPYWHTTLFANGTLFTRPIWTDKWQPTYTGTWRLEGNTLHLTEMNKSMVYSTSFCLSGRKAHCPYGGKVMLVKIR